jgi:hypothetical protein
VNVFFIAPQRSGTKAFGNIAKMMNFQVTSWADTVKNGIAQAFVVRDWSKIEAIDSNEYDCAFEDYPYFDFEFVKWAFYNTDSRFVYLGRDSETWFESMLTHSKGRSPGLDISHADTYNQWEEFAFVSKNLKSHRGPTDINGLDIRFSKKYYMDWHDNHRRQLVAFSNFHFQLTENSSRFFFREWNDLDLQELAGFMGYNGELRLNADSEHVHKTRNKEFILQSLYQRNE